MDNRRAPLPTDHKEIAPRFGFAWSPDAKTVVRGGYGIYYATIDFQIDYSVYALGVTPSGFRPIAQVLTTIQTAGAQSSANIFSTLRAEGVIGIPTPTRSITPGGSDSVRHQHQPDWSAASSLRCFQRIAELPESADPAVEPRYPA